MIHVENLSFKYNNTNKPVLEGLSFHVPSGSIFGLMGPNGSGKTTLISILTGLLPVMSGRVTIGNLDIADNIDSVRGTFSLIPQQNTFYERLTVEENLSFFSNVLSIPAKDRKKRIANTVESVGLSKHNHIVAGTLSGGMQRRLSVACGMLNNPKLLFLDEPGTGLDPQARSTLQNTLRAINKTGTTIVLCSHFIEEMEDICDHMLILNNGKQIRCGPIEDIAHSCGRSVLNIELGPDVDHSIVSRTSEIHPYSINGHLISYHNVDLSTATHIISTIESLAIPVTSIKFGSPGIAETYMSLTSDCAET